MKTPTSVLCALAALSGAFSLPTVEKRSGYDSNPGDLGAGANPALAGKNSSYGMNPNSSLFVKDPSYRTFSDFDFQR
jgi:hypothetical protein